MSAERKALPNSRSASCGRSRAAPSTLSPYPTSKRSIGLMRPKPRRILPAVLALAGLVAFTTLGHAQSVTTGAAGGTITDQNGAPLANVSIVFTYRSTGFRVSGITNERGAVQPPGPAAGRLLCAGQPDRLPHRDARERDDRPRSVGPSRRVAGADSRGTGAADRPGGPDVGGVLADADRYRDDHQRGAAAGPPDPRPPVHGPGQLTPQIVATDANGGLGLSVVGSEQSVQHHSDRRVDGERPLRPRRHGRGGRTGQRQADWRTMPSRNTRCSSPRTTSGRGTSPAP